MESPRPTRRRIASAGDEFQALASLLSNRTKRHRRREFLVHGVRPISAAFAAGWPVRALLYPSGRKLSRWADALVAAGRVREVVEVEPELFVELSQRDEPGELVALADVPSRSIGEIVPDRGVVLVLERPQSPGNLGTILRTAAAFGAAGVVVTGHAADPFDPRCVRASTGAIFTVPVVSVPGIHDVQDWVSATRGRTSIRVVGTSARGAPIDSGDLTPPVVVLFGNEARGLGRAALALCDEVVAVPGASLDTPASLNVAAAASIVLYEIARRDRVGANESVVEPRAISGPDH